MSFYQDIDGQKVSQNILGIREEKIVYHLAILGPRPHGHRKHLIMHLHESRILHPSFQLRSRLGLYAEHLETLDELRGPLVQWTAALEIARGGVEAHVEVLELDPAPWFRKSNPFTITSVSPKVRM